MGIKMTNIEFTDWDSNETIMFSVPKKVANAIKTIILELAEDNENVMWSTSREDY
jgi:hypothetical protein